MNSIDVDGKLIHSRFKLNYTPEEVSTKIISMDSNMKNDVRIVSTTNQRVHKIPTIRQSMTINDQYDLEKPDIHATYRLPSISPNSKLPS